MGYVLNEAGMDYGNVVTCHVYLADISNYQTMNKVYASYFEAGSYPARTTLEMPGLPGGAEIEVSCIAYGDRSRIRVVTPRDRSAPVTKNPLNQAVWAGDRLYLAGRGGRNDDTGKFDAAVEAQTQKAMGESRFDPGGRGLDLPARCLRQSLLSDARELPKAQLRVEDVLCIGNGPESGQLLYLPLAGA